MRALTHWFARCRVNVDLFTAPPLSCTKYVLLRHTVRSFASLLCKTASESASVVLAVRQTSNTQPGPANYIDCTQSWPSLRLQFDDRICKAPKCVRLKPLQPDACCSRVDATVDRYFSMPLLTSYVSHHSQTCRATSLLPTFDRIGYLGWSTHVRRGCSEEMYLIFDRGVEKS